MNKARYNAAVIEKLVDPIKIPPMLKIRQHFPRPVVKDVVRAVREELNRPEIIATIKPGMKVALTGGSRGVANIAVIIREVASFLKAHGAEPFIIPAMGSHGGATAAGQVELLASYGITEENCGCPIRATMDTVKIGYTAEGMPVYIDRYAYEADGIIPINRVKPHSAFRGKYESGLIKMLAIGMGKQRGADSLHEAGFKDFAVRLPQFAEVIIEKTNVMFGVATVENAYDETALVRVIETKDLWSKEPELLKYAFDNIPRILLPETDVLIVQEIGKNFSGSGMDPNVTGTWNTPYGSGGIKSQKVVVLDLSAESHGNAIGAGSADIGTMRLYDKIDFAATYPNALTSTVIRPAKVPMIMPNDKLAIKAAIKTCNGIDKERPRVVLIKNTMSLDEIYVSEAFREEIKGNDSIEILEERVEMSFDENGNLLSLF